MTSPLKPWEAGGSNLRSEKDVSPLSIQSSSRIPDVNIKTMPAVPPPLPPRPSNVSIRRPLNSAIGGVPNLYRSYPTTPSYLGGYNSYGGYGNYGSYGGYNGLGGYSGGQYPGYMYNYPNANDPNNRLVALAEESTRPAFESIESVVRAFGSVSFMLESTLGALHASFRAALGVADHLSHLRNILSALSVFRLLQWIIRRIRKLFGVKFSDSALGNCWGDAMKAGEQTTSAAASPPVSSQWPLGFFMGIVLSGSYLAWRLLSYVIGSSTAEQLSPFKAEENELWVQCRDPGCFLAFANHDFLATLDQELPFRAGDRLVIAPRNRQPLEGKDWLLAAHLWNPKNGGHPKIGLVPSNYIRLLDRKNIRLQGGNPLINTQSAPISGLQAQIPVVSSLPPQNYTALSAPSFQVPQPSVHPRMSLPSDPPPQLLTHSNTVNKSENLMPDSNQKKQSEVNVKDSNQAFVASETSASAVDGIVGRENMYSPVIPTVKNDSGDEKQPVSEA